MLLLIDNYDSFTYNLVQYFGELGVPATVYRNDAISVEQAVKLGPTRIVISPGPCTPDQSGITLALIERMMGHCPILGVCLGHQAIAQVLGGTVVRAPKVMHGKTSPIFHKNGGVFTDLPSPFQATRYHSLTVAQDSVPAELEITAWTGTQSAPQVIMGLRSESLKLEGVQFHPESIKTEHGHQLLQNFLDLSAVD